MKIFHLSIQCLSYRNDSVLFERGIVDILKKYMDLDDKMSALTVKLCRQVSMNTNVCAELMKNGVIDTLITLLTHQNNDVKINALYTIGNVAQQSSDDALILVHEKNVVKFIESLLLEVKNTEKELLASSIYCLKNLCKYSPHHLEQFINRNMFSYFNNLYMDNILRDNIENMFVLLLQHCSDFSILEKILLSNLSNINKEKNNVLDCVLDLFCEILTRDVAARKSFVQHDLLRIILNLAKDPHGPDALCSAYQSQLDRILSCFPTELIRYFDHKFQSFICKRI